MSRLCAVLTILAAVLATSPALAADAFIATTSQVVSFNAGRGFVKVPRLKPVPAGTQVMANETGSGWIIYCGCDVEINPGKVYTVQNRECKVESVNIRQPGLPHIVNYPDGQRGQEEVTKCAIPVLPILAGAGAAVGICAAAGCFDDDDDRGRKKVKKKELPVSP